MSDPHQRVEKRGDPHQRVEVRDPAHYHDLSLLEQFYVQLEMKLGSSEMEMKSKISIIIKTGFRPLLFRVVRLGEVLDSERERERNGLRGCRKMD